MSKGFVYLVEIAIAAVLLTVILTVFLGINTKLNWERSDLIATGNNILELLSETDIKDILNSDFSSIENLKAPNVGFGIKIFGLPKENINVGCHLDACEKAENILTSAFVNDRWVNFNLEEIEEAGVYNLNKDALIFIGQSDFITSDFKSKLENYINNGGVVIAINGTYNNNLIEFNKLFNLTPASGSSSKLRFLSYNPSEEKISKYFLGFGFDVKLSGGVGTWKIWEESKQVNLDGTTITIDDLGPFVEGSTFSLNGPDGSYNFKVKRIRNNRVDFQPLGNNFPFKDFSEDNINGNGVVVNLGKSYAALTSKNSAIWISDFPDSDEYRTLVKASIASRVIDWFLVSSDPEKENVYVSSFVSSCCDMPEIGELILILWYKF